MSEDIEELVNNLNISLTYAIKTTLGPYVQKLNTNNERCKIITNILKSLPEYKDMENEILHFNNEKQQFIEQIRVEKHQLLEQFNMEKQQLIEQLNNAISHNNDLIKVNEYLRSLLNQFNSVPDTTAIVSDTVVDEKINVGLNVIEKVDNVVTTDFNDKLKEIYSEAKIECVNKNIVAQLENDVKQIKLVSVPDDVCDNDSSIFISKTEREKEIEDIVLELERHLSEEEEDEEEEEDVSKVEEDEEVEDEEEEDVSKVEEAEAEDEEELFAINIAGFKNEFYTSDKLNGDIYEVNSDDSVGKLLGKFKNGKPEWKK
jgi:hypothetical protein